MPSPRLATLLDVDRSNLQKQLLRTNIRPCKIGRLAFYDATQLAEMEPRRELSEKFHVFFQTEKRAGATTHTLLSAIALSLEGWRVLMIDLDSDGLKLSNRVYNEIALGLLDMVDPLGWMAKRIGGSVSGRVVGRALAHW